LALGKWSRLVLEDVRMENRLLLQLIVALLGLAAAVVGLITRTIRQESEVVHKHVLVPGQNRTRFKRATVVGSLVLLGLILASINGGGPVPILLPPPPVLVPWPPPPHAVWRSLDHSAELRMINNVFYLNGGILQPVGMTYDRMIFNDMQSGQGMAFFRNGATMHLLPLTTNWIPGPIGKWEW
jgi:hypothetical protein